MKALVDKQTKKIQAIVEEFQPHWMIAEGIHIIMEVPTELETIPSELLEIITVPAVEAVQAVAERWSNGTQTVYNVNDIPTLQDENGEPSLDLSYKYKKAIIGVAAVSTHESIGKISSADQELRNRIMSPIRTKRDRLLAEADIMINIRLDKNEDVSALRVYRQALRDITEPFKKVNGDWKTSVDLLTLETFIFPSKP